MQAQNTDLLLNKIEEQNLLNHPSFKFTTTPITPTAIDEENKALLNDVSIIVFLGSWCSDSQELLPVIHNYLEQLNVPKNNVVYYGLDETKMSTHEWEQKFTITFVPTMVFISKKTGKELGRIVERFNQSISADIHAILQK